MARMNPLQLRHFLWRWRMLVIGKGQELHPASLFPTMKNTIINVDIRAHLAKAWEITLWAKHWTRFPNRPSHTRLKGQYILGGSIYNGRTNPVEHVSYFNQRMSVHSKDEALMCKVFPSSLGPVAIKWFNGLKADSIDSFKELTWAFGSRFITCSRVSQPLDSLLSLSMRVGETLKTYLDRY